MDRNVEYTLHIAIKMIYAITFQLFIFTELKKRIMILIINKMPLINYKYI